MATTWGQLKADLRAVIFPAGEAVNLVKAHDKSFLDAIIDLQQWVTCLQQDNTDLFPQCATLYNCGITVFDAPRGFIKRLSVIDKINPTTHLEDAASPDDWCSEIDYIEVDALHIHAYWKSSRFYGCCLPLPYFFGIDPALCGKGAFPVPTDVGVPKGLPALPLGFHYPQSSTNSSAGRARAGVWAKERGKIYVAPWLQTTETAVLTWDGIKRIWSDSDKIDDDPLLAKAIKLYVQAQHAGEFDKEYEDKADFRTDYNQTRAELIRQCREETRVRFAEVSHARGTAFTTAALFFNEDQSATATCPDGTTGNPVTVTIPAGTVGSNISVADANQKAQDQALTQAKAQLNCVTNVPTFTNDAQTATVACTVTEGSPPPEGTPVTVTVPAGTITSTVSKADANAQALALAQTQAAAQLSCTYWNAAQTYTANCTPPATGTPVTKTVAAHTWSSTVSQADADAKAFNDAKTQAESAIVCSGGSTFFNTPQIGLVTRSGCREQGGHGFCSVTVQYIIAAHTVSSTISQADANAQALALGQALANSRAYQLCLQGLCGSYTYAFP